MRPAATASAAREGAAHEQRAHDQFGDDEEGGETGDRQQQREFDGAVLRVRGARLVAGGEPPRHFRQHDGAGGDADDADRQLVDAVGVIERRERAGRQEARDDGVGEQRELHAGRADRRRPERAEELPHVGVELRPAKRRQARRRARHRRRPAATSQHAGDQHAPGRGVAGGRKERRERERDHRARD